MDSEELLKLIKSRRSIRLFDAGRRIDPSAIEKIIEAGVWAPTGSNQQELRFIVVEDERLLEEFARYKKIKTITALLLIYIDFESYYAAFGPKRKYHPHSRNLPWVDVGLAMMNMLLMAESLGLRSVPLNISDYLSYVSPGHSGLLWRPVQRLAVLLHRSWFGITYYDRFTELLGLDGKRYLPGGAVGIGYSEKVVDLETATHRGGPIMRKKPGAYILQTFPRRDDHAGSVQEGKLQ